MSAAVTKCCDGAFARALEAASAQIELALQESQAPMEYLSETVRRQADMLRDLTIELTESTAHSLFAAGTMDRQLENLRSSLRESIEKLQFHDRMVQHLTHVRNFLASLANQLDATGEFRGLESASPTDEDWDELNSRFRKRLISDAQRELLDLILGAEYAAEIVRARDNDYAAQGSIELF